jgi:hypothetical protein
MSGECPGDWLDGLLPPGKAGVIAVLKCSVGESGTHGAAAPILVVAGCAATARQWRLLAQEWLPQIRGLPKGYHAKRRDCEALNVVLAEIMRRRMDHTLAITIIEDEYKQYASPRFRSTLGSAYALAVHSLVHRVGGWCDQRNIRYVAYVLEGGHKNQDHVNELFRLMTLTANRPRYTPYTWSNKADPTLHPADLLSHELSTQGPLARMLGDRAQQEHIGPEEIKELEEVVLGGPDKWKHQIRLRRKQRNR